MPAIRAVLLGLGLAGIAYAVVGILTDNGTSPVHQGLFLAGLIVVHDGILMPLAIGVAALTVRYLPVRVRPPVQLGLYASLVVTILALPFVIGAGRVADNPTILPLNYARGLWLVLGVIWLAAAIWVVVRCWPAWAHRR
jgi:hypothetical protein